MINWSWLWQEWIKPLGGAVVLALVIIVFVAQSFKVDGVSMENTLLHGERLMVDKLTYRFRPAKRGEIIVLNAPGGSRFIKRVIAVGGDVIQERDGLIYLNGIALDEPYVENRTNMNWGPILVPQDHVWVMGDNRPRSDDSRGTVGFLPVEEIVGRALFRYWPLSRVSIL